MDGFLYILIGVFDGWTNGVIHQEIDGWFAGLDLIRGRGDGVLLLGTSLDGSEYWEKDWTRTGLGTANFGVLALD